MTQYGFLPYQADSDDNTKQKPGGDGITTQFNKATLPPAATNQEKPNQVIVSTGSIAFAYQSGSLSTYVSGAVVPPNAGPVTLPIQPIAWYRTDAAGAVGDVTFIYKRRG